MLKPRKTPCASCPYRKNVPSGVWHEEEYDKLPKYDGDIPEQIENDGLSPFMCHNQNECLCSGWVAHRDPYDLIAVRLGIANGNLDPSVIDYTTDVPLFGTGAEASAHGKKDIDSPGPEAVEAIRKIVTKSEL